MRSACIRMLSCAAAFVFLLATAEAATVTGTVKGPDGAPFEGAFVQAHNKKNDITTHVLSDKNGHYTIDKLPAGSYRIDIRAIGYQAEPRDNVELSESQHASYDFNLQNGMIRWTDLSNYQGRKLLPADPAKAQLTGTCFGCHGFQSRMAAQKIRTETAWRARVRYMRTTFGYFLRGSVTDQDADRLVAYLTKLWGPNSELPQSPSEMPNWDQVKTAPFSDAAMNIVYVSYPLLGDRRFPGAARPQKDGLVWIWTYNKARFSSLNPKTGEVKEYNIPGMPNDQGAVHSVVEAPDGSIWFTMQAANIIGKLDPATGQITKYEDKLGGNQRHTMAITSKGIIYSTGRPLAKFDPKTQEWTNYDEVPTAYGITLDKDENVWFSEFTKNGQIGKIDAKTGKITKYKPPTEDPRPRRMKYEPRTGLIWFAEYRAGKIASFDPKTEKFKEYDLPGASPTPYALNYDKKGHIWYSSMDMDVVGELNPSTGEVIEYPFPYSENGMRDFFLDDQGRMWWGSQPNDRVGYFYLAKNLPPGTNHTRNQAPKESVGTGGLQQE